MAVVAVFQDPSLTREQLREVRQRLTGGKSRMDSPTDWPVERLLAHIAGQGENGFRVVDVWESEDAYRRFEREILTPAMGRAGLEAPAGEPPPLDAFEVHSLRGPAS